MNYEINDTPTKNEWENALKQFKQEDNFFTDWNRTESFLLIKKTIVRIIIKENNKIICLYQTVVEHKKAGFINLLNVRCGRREGEGIFIDSNEPKILLKKLIKHVKGILKKKFGFFTLFYFSFYLEKKNDIFKNWKYKIKQTPIINLSPSLDDLTKNLNKKTRNEIKQAKKRDCKVLIMNNDEGLKNYFNLNKYYWKKLNNDFWLKNEKLFYEYHNNLLKNNLINIFIATVNKKPAAFALIWSVGKNIAVYGNGGYDINYQWNRPSNLVLWESIIWSKENGFKFFDMGGGVDDPKNSKKYNITKFKIGFGAEMKNFYNYYKISI